MKTTHKFKYIRIISIFLVILLMVALSLFAKRQIELNNKPKVYPEYVLDKHDQNGVKGQTAKNNSVIQEPGPLPDNTLLKVPFTSQAPNANWDPLHEEACEEASLLMVKHYQDKTDFGSTSEKDQEITSLVNWEADHSYKVDVTVIELSEIAKNRFDMNTARIKNDPSVDDIKRELASGRPVIIPAAGRLLGNPNFTGAGPIYHMLVIKGYDTKGFIVNDPGTRKGENYRYSFDTIMNAIHDWNAQDILQGDKAYLVFD